MDRKMRVFRDIKKRKTKENKLKLFLNFDNFLPW